MMRTIRRVGGMAVAGLLLSSMIGGTSASADTTTISPETYIGSAAGRALALKVGSVSASSGVSSAKLDSTLKVVSEGAGTLGLPVIGGLNTTKAEVSGDNTKVNVPQSCATPDLSAVPAQAKPAAESAMSALAKVLTVGAACSTSLAEVVNGLPHALSEASVLSTDVTLNNVLSQVPDEVGSGAATVKLADVKDTVVDTLLGGLDQVNKQAQALPAAGSSVPDLKLDDTVGELLERLQSTKTLELKVGTSKSEVVTNGSTVTSTATSAGGVLGLLPVQLPLASGGTMTKSLVEIVIGSAKATASYDRVAGKNGVPTYDPAIVTIRINTPTTDSLGKVLGIDLREVVINPGLVPSQVPALTAKAGSTVSGTVDPYIAEIVTACPDAPNEFCVLYGTPFETRIAVASGRTVNNPDGTVGAIADAVKIHALKNLSTAGVGGVAPASPLDGGLLLELAHAEAGVGGAPADQSDGGGGSGAPELPRADAPDLPRELPRTGGTPWMPIAGVLGLALAVIGRRALVRSH